MIDNSGFVKMRNAYLVNSKLLIIAHNLVDVKEQFGNFTDFFGRIETVKMISMEENEEIMVSVPLKSLPCGAYDNAKFTVSGKEFTKTLVEHSFLYPNKTP